MVISAYLSRDLQQALKELGIDHILPKPFNIGELRTMVDEVGKVDSAALTWAKLLKFMQIGLEDPEKEK